MSRMVPITLETICGRCFETIKSTAHVRRGAKLTKALKRSLASVAMAAHQATDCEGRKHGRRT